MSLRQTYEEGLRILIGGGGSNADRWNEERVEVKAPRILNVNLMQTSLCKMVYLVKSFSVGLCHHSYSRKNVTSLSILSSFASLAFTPYAPTDLIFPELIPKANK
ncbi:hypothetical protein Tco_0620742 [Tanacetum coccineum]